MLLFCYNRAAAVVVVCRKSITKETWPIIQWSADDSTCSFSVTNTVHVCSRAEGFAGEEGNVGWGRVGWGGVGERSWVWYGRALGQGQGGEGGTEGFACGEWGLGGGDCREGGILGVLMGEAS